MSVQLIVGLVALLLGSGGLAGIVAAVLHNQKKLGQKQAEAEHATLDAENAKAAGAVVAQRVDPADVVDRLRNHQF